MCSPERDSRGGFPTAPPLKMTLGSGRMADASESHAHLRLHGGRCSPLQQCRRQEQRASCALLRALQRGRHGQVRGRLLLGLGLGLGLGVRVRVRVRARASRLARLFSGVGVLLVLAHLVLAHLIVALIAALIAALLVLALALVLPNLAAVPL